jgi:hypothetical protein
MSKNVFNNHPLIKNSNQYFLEKKYISISSEDRDITKYPDPSEFEMLLPQEYLNIVSAKLYSWSFPANYNVFSGSYYNIFISFKMVKLYNPGEHDVSNALLEGIFAALHNYGDKEILVEIETGFYNPDQMTIELTNKFNDSVTKIINLFLNNPLEWGTNDYNIAKQLFDASQGYNRFKIVYNAVSQKLWFGNETEQFILTNDSSVFITRTVVNNLCQRKNLLPEWSNWGLPAYLGFSRCNATSDTSSEIPRFCYGDAVIGSGDNGFWLLPKLPGAEVYFLQAPYKISFMGPAYMYMEVDGWNCIDETSPYNLSLFTSQTNQTNGIVNSCFAKIPIPTTPISQWFDNDMGPYKYWNPPAERISKIKVKFRYHNGSIVEFGQFEYSFMIELNILKPQQEKSYSIVNAYDLAQHQSLGSKFV